MAARGTWLACALGALAGWAVLDDYGVSTDEAIQRQTAQVTLDYVLGRDEALLSYQDRRYGAVFEVLPLGAERLLGLQDSRAIYLVRHGLTHLLFLAGGLAGASVAFRLYGRRWLALAALGLFLLHPRLYAHSFFNSKDIPFLSLFMAGLWLAQRAFRRGTGGGFALCGAGMGLLINVRLMGVLLFAAVLAVRACDVIWAADRAARQRALRTGGLCAATAALTLYATLPYLWGDPVSRFAEVFSYWAQFPHFALMLFRGDYVSSLDLPPAYVPVWFALTAPPFALLLGGVGAAALGRRAVRAPSALVRNTRLRFEGLLLACCVLPVLAVILLGSTLYMGWRHLYFLYAPFCLLATGGLYALAATARRFWRAWAGGIGSWAGVGATATLAAMVALHPDQHLYFNFLEDRVTSERLRIRYDLDYWAVSSRRALEFLLAQYPEDIIYVHMRGNLNRKILSAADRQRIALTDAGRADFHITQHRAWWYGGPSAPPPYAPIIHARKVYGSTVFAIVAVNLERAEAAAEPYRTAYRALAARVPDVRDRFDVHVDAQAVRWVRAPCVPEDAASRFVLYVTPREARDLPAYSRDAGWDNLSFYFSQRGVRVDDACLAVAPLPAYPIRHLRVGQWLTQEKRMLWQADLPVPSPPAVARAYRALAPPAALHREPFDVYATRSAVTLAKAPCTAADVQPRFILHVTPADPRVLPGRPFANQDFHFSERGVRAAGACLVTAPLPAWPVRRLTVSQWRAETERTLWQADLPLASAPRAVDAYRAAYRALAAAAPAYRGPFDVYVTAATVAYAKASCTAADTEPKFILHVVPVRARDLPPARRRAGFANRDFEFAWQGAHFDGACLARAALPAYPVARVRVGQFRAGAAVWQVEIPLAR